MDAIGGDGTKGCETRTDGASSPPHPRADTPLRLGGWMGGGPAPFGVSDTAEGRRSPVLLPMRNGVRVAVEDIPPQPPLPSPVRGRGPIQTNKPPGREGGGRGREKSKRPPKDLPRIGLKGRTFQSRASVPNSGRSGLQNPPFRMWVFFHVRVCSYSGSTARYTLYMVPRRCAFKTARCAPSSSLPLSLRFHGEPNPRIWEGEARSSSGPGLPYRPPAKGGR